VADTREKVTLALDRGRVAVEDGRPSPHAVRGGDHVAQLLIGADEPGEVIRAAGMKVTGDARQLVPILFPNQHPQLAQRDRF
jgi:hypothetical protein